MMMKLWSHWYSFLARRVQHDHAVRGRVLVRSPAAPARRAHRRRGNDKQQRTAQLAE